MAHRVTRSEAAKTRRGFDGLYPSEEWTYGRPHCIKLPDVWPPSVSALVGNEVVTLIIDRVGDAGLVLRAVLRAGHKRECGTLSLEVLVTDYSEPGVGVQFGLVIARDVDPGLEEAVGRGDALVVPYLVPGRRIGLIITPRK